MPRKCLAPGIFCQGYMQRVLSAILDLIGFPLTTGTRSLDYRSRFRAQVTQAHRKLRGISGQALETPRRTDGMNRKRLKLGENDST